MFKIILSLSSFVLLLILDINDQLKPLLLVSALDIETGSEFAVFPELDATLTPPTNSCMSMLPTNDINIHIVHQKPKAKLNTPPLHRVEESVVKLVFPPLLDNIDADNKSTHLYISYKLYHILTDHCNLILKSL